MTKCNNETCEVKASFIEHEITNSLSHIKTQKDTAVGAIKIYLAIVFGFFAYISFLQTKIVTIANPIPNDMYSVFSIFGILLTSFIFIIGWILLDFITNSIFTSVVHYKHVSYMRSLKASVIGEVFYKHCIVPLSAKKINLKRSRQLPIIFSVFNFLLLCANYYFFSISQAATIAATYTMVIMGVFALFYPNVCAKYYEELLIAQRMKPGKDESRIRHIVRKRIKSNKNEPTHKRVRIAFNCFAFVFFLTMGINVYVTNFTVYDLPPVSLYSEAFILLLLSIFRYVIAQYRIEKVICVFGFQAKKV